MPELSLWVQSTSCLPFELPTPIATSFICQSTVLQRCQCSVFSQQEGKKKIDNRTHAGGWQARFYRLWHCVKEPLQTQTLREKTGEKLVSFLSPTTWHWVKELACVHRNGFGVCAPVEGSEVWMRAACVCRVLCRAPDHAVKWKVLVHNRKPSRQ